MRVLLHLGELAWAQALCWGMRDKEACARRGGGVLRVGGEAAEYIAHAPLPFSFFPCRLAQADRHAFLLICVV